MSVPVRYSAAANYAVVDSGLSNTLTQEEQYHQFQQQQQQQQQLYCQFVASHSHSHSNSSNNNECNFNGIGIGIGIDNGNNSYNGYNGLGEQQQLMQQRSSMSSSVSPSQGLPANINISNIDNSNPTTTAAINNIIGNFNYDNSDAMDNYNINDINLVVQGEEELHHHYHHHQENQMHLLHGGHSLMYGPSAAATASEQSELPLNGVYDESEMMKPMTSTSASSMAVAAAAAAGTAGDGSDDNAEMRTEWRMSDEGRYGTPGAAGLEYQKYELEQQQQQPPANRMNNNFQPMDPSLMDNENRNMKKNNNINTNTNINSNKNNPNANSANNNNNNNNTNTNSNNKNVVDELNAMSTDELYRLLKEYDVLQDKYHTVLLLPRESKREVTAGGRDGSAYVLRCLKMWYELPSDVLFSAMSLVDRFLDRMAVKPKHMACMSVASFHLAIKQLGLKPIPTEDLVTISQCGCTAGDLERMAGVIANKLGVQTGVKPVTSVTILRVFYALFRNLARDLCPEFFEFYQQMIKLEDLENRLENLLCDVKTTVITPSTLALVLMCLHLDFHIKASYTRGRPELKAVFEYILFLQQFLRIPDRVFTCGFSIVADILSHYNGQNKQPYKQRLVWKLSSRTLKVLRPTNRFSSDLPTIEEGMPNAMDDGCRSRTESISSEEEEDWPTSPIIPIFEQC